MANHLEQLVSEWLVHRNYFVRQNIKAGKLAHGGHEGELDIVAYNPETDHLLHIEPSIDAHDWTKRETRFSKKFIAGKKYIIPAVFPWLSSSHTIEQWAVLWGSDCNHTTVGGGKVVPLGDFYRTIVEYVRSYGSPLRNAIPEGFPLLRAIQYSFHYIDNPSCKA